MDCNKKTPSAVRPVQIGEESELLHFQKVLKLLAPQHAENAMNMFPPMLYRVLPLPVITAALNISLGAH